MRTLEKNCGKSTCAAAIFGVPSHSIVARVLHLAILARIYRYFVLRILYPDTKSNSCAIEFRRELLERIIYGRSFHLCELRFSFAKRDQNYRAGIFSCSAACVENEKKQRRDFRLELVIDPIECGFSRCMYVCVYVADNCTLHFSLLRDALCCVRIVRVNHEVQRLRRVHSSVAWTRHRR